MKGLSKRCPNRLGWKVHEHIKFEGGRTRAAQIYQEGLCKAICRGLDAQLKVDAQQQFLLANIASDTTATSKELMKAAEYVEGKYRTVEEDLDDQLEEAWDDVSGAQLDPKVAKLARQEEIDYIHKMNLYTKVPVQECHQKAGKGTISVRWIDVNKGDIERPNYRSRLVAREINTHKRDDLFSATPLLEVLKLLVPMAATNNRGEVIMINEVSRAFFHAKATRTVYVQLPNEDQGHDGKPMCGRLNFSMYGTRDAAMNWQAEYSQRIIDNGFEQGKAPPVSSTMSAKGFVRLYTATIT